MSKHTPGPWHAFPTTTESGYTGYWYVGRKNNPPQPTMPIAATVENQHLIEAAPDLKTFAKAFLLADDETIYGPAGKYALNDLRNIARLAIDKAEGR